MNTIPAPSPSQLNKYLARWNTLKDYSLQEKALNKLFRALCPSNSDIEDILIKCSALNDFYSTNIFKVTPVAEHILELNIDDRLKAGDLSLVENIANVEIGGKPKRFYSFASKYCSHHNPEAYAIYDYYVEKCLVYFKECDDFSVFSSADLKKYETFVRALRDFQMFYGLENYSLKQIDQYLWQIGKEYFPKNY